MTDLVRKQDARDEIEYNLLIAARNTPAAARQPRGPRTPLNCAASAGSTERTLAALSKGFYVNQACFDGGYTPLMQAADRNYLRVVRILLSRGADPFVESDDGYTALTFSARGGYLAMTRVLIKAGSDLDHGASGGDTPLHYACEGGHCEVVSMLIDAGANVDSRASDGATPLYVAAYNGHVGAVRLLLRAQADPLLTKVNTDSGKTCVPLDVAAGEGHSDVVKELIQRLGIEGCGGASGGVDALKSAAEYQRVHTMAVLTDAGVVDTGKALAGAARNARGASAKILLRQQAGKYADKGAYVDNKCGPSGRTPLLQSIATKGCGCCPKRRFVRLLMDAGADTTSSVRLVDETTGEALFDDTPLAFTDKCIREVTDTEESWREERLLRLKDVRRLLLRANTVHAESWLWPDDAPSIAKAKGDTTSTSPRMGLRILRPKNDSHRRIILSRLFRWVETEARFVRFVSVGTLHLGDCFLRLRGFAQMVGCLQPHFLLVPQDFAADAFRPG